MSNRSLPIVDGWAKQKLSLSSFAPARASVINIWCAFQVSVFFLSSCPFWLLLVSCLALPLSSPLCPLPLSLPLFLQVFFTWLWFSRSSAAFWSQDGCCGPWCGHLQAHASNLGESCRGFRQCWPWPTRRPRWKCQFAPSATSPHSLLQHRAMGTSCSCTLVLSTPI